MIDPSKFKVIGKSPAREDAFDKVRGRAVFGFDVQIANAIYGVVLRSPHTHARIVSIDSSEAEKMPGVYAVVTSKDFPELRPGGFGDIARENLADGKVLFHSQGVAAVAAKTEDLARQAAAKIKIEYEALPHVMTIDEAIADDAPILHEGISFDGSEGRSNIHEKIESKIGDIEAGFAQADVVRERTYTTPVVHQGYIEPTACAAIYSEDSQSTVWSTTQGHHALRDMIALNCGLTSHELKVIPTEIGGGFGGKTAVYLEAIALMLSKKSGRPVKMRMTREEVLRCGGPAAATKIRVKIGIKKDGSITAMQGHMLYDSGCFPSAPTGGAVRSIFTAYDCPNVYIEGYSVVTNKVRVRAYRGPGAPQACYAAESLLNELCDEIGMDPIEVRLKNAIRDNAKNVAGIQFRELGLVACLEAARDSDHYQSELKPGQGRAISAGFWFNAGGYSSATINMHKNGFVSLTTGSADLSGTRTALAQIAAETLNVPIEHVHAEVGDTDDVGNTGVTGGSRTVNATGQAVHQASLNIIDQLKERAASGWNVLPTDVEWDSGKVINTKNPDETLTLRDITRAALQTGGAITADSSVNIAGGLGPSFGVHICDVEVDEETGKTLVTRYTVIQDAGVAVHPQFVEGQYQGGAVQGIGWALNEEYIYDENGVLQNPGFLDYRMPVASDLPMIETIVVQVPNSMHPFGVRGVGEVPIIPPLGAVGSAIANAIKMPVADLPASPVRVLGLIQARDGSASAAA